MPQIDNIINLFKIIKVRLVRKNIQLRHHNGSHHRSALLFHDNSYPVTKLVKTERIRTQQYWVSWQKTKIKYKSQIAIAHLTIQITACGLDIISSNFTPVVFSQN